MTSSADFEKLMKEIYEAELESKDTKVWQPHPMIAMDMVISAIPTRKCIRYLQIIVL